MMLCLHCMKQNNNQTSNFCAHCGKPFGAIRTPQHHLRPGTRLCNGKYILGTAIGEGGFGITYIGRDLNLDLRVAIKEYYLSGYVSRSLSDNYTVSSVVSVGKEDAEAIFRKGRDSFHDEARILARLSGQPGIVNVRDFFRENNTVYIVMEYLNGSTLKQILKSGKLFTEDEIKKLLYPIITSMAKIHEESLLHRDISPDNIMVLNNSAKLIDFGAARGYASAANRSSSIIVKPGYAPIEQYGTKREQGPWTDIYALCATMYRCITGKVPDIATDRVVSDELKSPSQLGFKVSPEFERILLKGMSVLKKDRYQSVGELIHDLYATNHAKPVRHDPVIKPESGSYNAPLAINMSTDIADAKIYFTIDGSDPVGKGKLYTRPVTLGGADGQSTNVHINAITVINNKVAGACARDYQIISSDPLLHDITATIPVPTAGELFPRPTLQTKGAVITSIRWMEGDAPARDATLKENRIYSLMMTVKADDKHIFADDLVAAIGGISAEVHSNPNGTVTIVRHNIRPAIDSNTHTERKRMRQRKEKAKKRRRAIIISVILIIIAVFAGYFISHLPMSAPPNTDDLSLPVVCIGERYYEMPIKVQTMLNNGWELAESEKDSIIAANSSRYVQFVADGSNIMRMVTNTSDRDIRSSDGLLYSQLITASSADSISLAGVTAGTPLSELEAKLQNVEHTTDNGVYIINGQNNSTIKIFVSAATDEVDRISIDIEK